MKSIQKDGWQWLLMLGAVGICMLLVVFAEDIFPWLRQEEDVTIPSQDNREVTMHTILSQDAIPAIDNPQFVSASQADSDYRDSELVIGVEINGDARAYSVPMLSNHEIVNDTVGGVPVAVTW